MLTFKMKTVPQSRLWREKHTAGRFCCVPSDARNIGRDFLLIRWRTVFKLCHSEFISESIFLTAAQMLNRVQHDYAPIVMMCSHHPHTVPPSISYRFPTIATAFCPLKPTVIIRLPFTATRPTPPSANGITSL